MVEGWRHSKEASTRILPFRDQMERGPVNSSSLPEEYHSIIQILKLHSAFVSSGGTDRFSVEKCGSGLTFTCEYLQNISYPEPHLGNNWDEISGGERQCIPESLNSSLFLLVDLSKCTGPRQALLSKPSDFFWLDHFSQRKSGTAHQGWLSFKNQLSYDFFRKTRPHCHRCFSTVLALHTLLWHTTLSCNAQFAGLSLARLNSLWPSLCLL